MGNNCNKLHSLFNKTRKLKFPFNKVDVPENGIYILFEKGEKAHLTNRIVRIGTHTGQNNLYKRLKEHFLVENKDRSIFRKNIGRALLNKVNDPFLKYWEIDLTTRKAREKYEHLIDFNKQKKIEKEVTKYIQKNFSFTVVEIKNTEQRMIFEEKIISTISLCDKCKPSKKWLGNYSPKVKIKESGLWLEQGLYREPLDSNDIKKLKI